MSAQIIDGKAFAAGLRARVGEAALAFAEKAGRKPGLAVVLVVAVIGTVADYTGPADIIGGSAVLAAAAAGGAAVR